MEDLSADDDILSDILIDNLEFEPAISTHKMNPNYRGQRFDRNTVSLIVRKRIVVEKDITAAIEEISKIGIVQKYLANKTPRQVTSFQSHARRYLESYLPDSGVEFALTTRYKRVMMEKLSKSRNEDPEPTSLAQSEKAEAGTSSLDRPTSEEKGRSKHKSRSSLDRAATSIGAAPAAAQKADLCVLAMRTFKPGELINYCKGGLKDLTKSEDDALREEAVTSKEKRRDAEYKGVLGPGRDFSVIRSARKGCSQLLLGPARFVNHDCNPNTEFYRNGSTMLFKVIRPIQRNEEITTFYGENYFEWANAECMCATCEARGTGAFSDPVASKSEASDDMNGSQVKLDDPSSSSSAVGTPSETNGRRASRRSGRPSSSALPSPSPTPSNTPSLSNAVSEDRPKDKKSKRDFLADLKLAEHGPSEDRSDPWAEGAGPKCRCLTCGATFWAPEKWWTPDECPRCERHYKIFKADWPGRVPTEGALARKAGLKNKSSSELISEHLASASPTRNGKERSATPTEFKAGPAAVSASGAATTPQQRKRGRPPKATSSGSKSGSMSVDSAPNKISSSVSTTPVASSSTAKSRGRPPKVKIESDHLQDEQDEDDVMRTLTKVKKSTVLPSFPAVKHETKETDQFGLDSDGSDLTPEPETDREEMLLDDQDDEDTGPMPSVSSSRSMMAGGGQLSSSTSSSTSPGPTGPKMLGKNAKTDVLAQYWGAAEGDRRARRKAPVHPGPTLIAANAARRPSEDVPGGKTTSARRQSFRDAESEDTAMLKHKRRLVAMSASDAEDDDLSISTPRESFPSTSNISKHRKTSSMSDMGKTLDLQRSTHEAKASPKLASAQSQALPANRPSPGHEHSQSPRASADNLPGLATTGTERTSESNLALFWSAGVEGTRQRRQAQREPQTVLTPSGPVKRQRRPSESSRSRTPEVKRPRGRPPKANGGNEDAEGSGQDRSGRSRSAAISDDLEGQERKRRREGEDSEMEEDGDEDDDNDERKPVVKPYMFSAISKALQSTDQGDGAGALDSRGPLLPSAPLFRPPGFTRPDLAAAAARLNSPLAGPPRGTPGQPMRKNLRWGSGKTSMSRPLGPNGSPLSLGRPLMGLNGSPGGVAPPLIRRSETEKPPLQSQSPANVASQHAPLQHGQQVDSPKSDIQRPPPISTQSEPPMRLDEEHTSMDVDLNAPPVSVLARPPPPLPPAVEEIKLESPTTLAPMPQIGRPEGLSPTSTESGGESIEDVLQRDDRASATPDGRSIAAKSVGPNPLALESPASATPSKVAHTAAENTEGGGRRTSGRARKPPEMAAGQISYKGSLIKLAAQRAKEAKGNSPRSTGTISPADSRHASPKGSARHQRRSVGDLASSSPSPIKSISTIPMSLDDSNEDGLLKPAATEPLCQPRRTSDPMPVKDGANVVADLASDGDELSPSLNIPADATPRREESLSAPLALQTQHQPLQQTTSTGNGNGGSNGGSDSVSMQLD